MEMRPARSGADWKASADLGGMIGRARTGTARLGVRRPEGVDVSRAVSLGSDVGGRGVWVPLLLAEVFLIELLAGLR
jgi:hypothetical protein